MSEFLCFFSHSNGFIPFLRGINKAERLLCVLQNSLCFFLFG